MTPAGLDHGGTAPVGELTDRQLMARHIGGDTDAFGELFWRYKDWMWGVVICICGDLDFVVEGDGIAFAEAVGTVLSTTFTLAVPEATLPCISVTVSVTVLTELIECVPSPEILF